jgi:hypothetical protein
MKMMAMKEKKKLKKIVMTNYGRPIIFSSFVKVCGK